jgi:hypothetical protein
VATTTVRNFTQPYLAFQNFVTQVQAVGGQIKAGTAVGSWQPGSLPNGGSFQLAYTNTTTPVGTSFINCFACEGHTGASVPLSSLTINGVGQPSIYISGINSTFAQADEVVFAIISAWGGALIALCGATLTVPVFTSATRPGAPVIALACGTALAYSATDQLPIHATVGGTAGLFNGATNNAFVGPAAAPSVTQIATIDAGSQDTFLLPDIETSINNGSQIYSASTTQFTEP